MMLDTEFRRSYVYTRVGFHMLRTLRKGAKQRRYTRFTETQRERAYTPKHARCISAFFLYWGFLGRAFIDFGLVSAEIFLNQNKPSTPQTQQADRPPHLDAYTLFSGSIIHHPSTIHYVADTPTRYGRGLACFTCCGGV